MIAKPHTPNHFPTRRKGVTCWLASRNTGNVNALGTFKDYSSNGNNVTLYGAAVVANGGLNPNNVDSYGEIANSASMQTNLTGCFIWVKPTDTTSNQKIVANFNGAAGNFIIGIVSGHAYIELWTSNGNYYGNAALGTITTGWCQLGLQYDPSNGYFELYVNGVLVGTQATDGLALRSYSGTTIFSKFPGNSLYSFTGLSDDCIFYNRYLPLGEIKRNYLKNKRG